MRRLSICIVVLSLTGTVDAAGPPLVERYLHSGELAKGEQALEAALAANPRDDQIRFGLGVLRFIRGVERLGQSLREYGVKSETTDFPFLRLPVPHNPQPAAITYTAFRRVVDDFVRDLTAAEATLAGITDDGVKLPLRLADIRLDLAGSGKPTDRFLDVMKKIMRQQQFDILKGNPDFLVCFDRGDVAWLRAYCHLLTGMLDFYLAFDTEQIFNLSSDEVFAKPKPPPPPRENRQWDEVLRVIVVKEPARLGRFRRHMIKVAELNRETWKYIRAETDDDHEWLPNAKQKGVLGMPVRDDMVDAWLGMMGEFEALLDGKRTLGSPKDGRGLSLKTLLDAPPEKLDFAGGFPGNLPDRYFSEAPEVDMRSLWRVMAVFQNTAAVAYFAWFN